jgi:hypothetical protein
VVPIGDDEQVQELLARVLAEERLIAQVAAAAKTNWRAHDFRRSLASFLIVAARADEAAVTAVMGHANIETTGGSTRATGARRRSGTRSCCASSRRRGSASDLRRNKQEVTTRCGEARAAQRAAFRPVTGRYAAKRTRPESA